MDKRHLRNLLLFVVFSMMIFSQPAQLLTQINVGQTKEPTISSTSYTSDVSAAHITSPTSIPIYHEWKADPEFFPQSEKIISLVPLSLDQYPFILGIMESTGFLDAIQYQSNYLPFS